MFELRPTALIICDQGDCSLKAATTQGNIEPRLISLQHCQDLRNMDGDCFVDGSVKACVLKQILTGKGQSCLDFFGGDMSNANPTVAAPPSVVRIHGVRDHRWTGRGCPRHSRLCRHGRGLGRRRACRCGGPHGHCVWRHARRDHGRGVVHMVDGSSRPTRVGQLDISA